MSSADRPGLTRQILIDTALRLLDEVGLDGLSVRRLAAEFGVKSPALYWHVRGKQELLDGMADAIIAAARVRPPRANETWQDWLTRRGEKYRRTLLAHRDGARVVTNAEWLSEHTIVRFNGELVVLVERGFGAALAMRTLTAITQYTNGFVLREQIRPTAVDRLAANRLDALTELLDADAPLLTALRAGAGTVGDRAYRHGLRALVDGTAEALARETQRA
ncbi:TetR/AcrR family transcriptional regulator C-terminal domain-containing protein [Nocardia pseudobrasiliensis]|nr:TetR/AcrR family transcriptional regulator C-terminal domain-containing protein [Nocardia pseudobrasiliensis]